MKTKIKMIIILTFIVQSIFAQQPITHNLYTTHNFLLNPAATGSRGGTALLFDVYNQWTSFAAAPKILTLGFETQLKKNSAVGLTIYNDQRSYFTHMLALFNYSYKVNFKNDANLAFGLGLGVVNDKLDFTGVNPEDPTDPLYNTTDYNKTNFEAAAGLLFDYKNLRLSLSSPMLLVDGTNFMGQYNAIGLYDIKAGDKLVLTPSVMVRTFPGLILQQDYNLMGTINEKYWLQFGYRSNKSLLFSGGLNFNMLTLGYCYEASGGEIENFASSGHEVILGIYLNKKKEEPKVHTGKVHVAVQMLDSKTKAPVAAAIKFKQNGILKYTGQGDDHGTCNLMADPGIYQVSAKAKGYVPIRENIELIKLDKAAVYTYNLAPVKLNKGVEFRVGNILFETNSDKILTESYTYLDDIAEALIENPKMIVEVGGHTDNTGTPDFNMDLSGKRSASVVDYLVSKGVNPDQLVAKGYGDTKPEASNETEAGKRQNRRVVFRVLEMDKTAIKPKAKTEPEKKVDVNANQIDVITNVTDQKYNSPVKGTVTIKQNENVKSSCISDNKGMCNFFIDQGQYTVEFKSPGYLPLTQLVDLSAIPKGSKYKLKLAPVKLEKDLVVNFGHINFRTNEDVLLPDSKVILDHAAEVFKEYPKMIIEVGGHTDNQASLKYNLTLSKKRTVSVANYLISKGVDKKQLVTHAYGLLHPIADNNTPEGRSQNRRVMFKILTMNSIDDPINEKTYEPGQ
ncbi:MAG: PorP/SprF family type IX secretion system membrane protein [Bacteroidetes bacterium]|nr:PorP/SprF family type IX secretion system membrane protein [Bacteroidota bacterium]